MDESGKKVLMAWRPAYEATSAVVWIIMAIVNYVIAITLSGQAANLAGLSIIMLIAAFIRGKAAYGLWVQKAKITLPIVLEKDMHAILEIHKKHGRKESK